ncbi:GATA transcription factor [Striga asiatica]|uniref:GATA transcription factor n=1 Tax=Striga asiatica TaxID=4170 RepID=A0A5A7Q8T1_STRAF|nr:GATA transcription factor [Striga asiatica]
MEIFGPAQACFAADDDLLDFTLDGGDGEEGEVDRTVVKGGASASSSSLESSDPAALPLRRGTQAGLLPEFVEEELEWLSNKDAFPAVETCFGILSDNPELVSSAHQSPVSVLENSISISSSHTNSGSITIASCCNSLQIPAATHPVRARNKRRKRTSGFGNLLPVPVSGPSRASGKSVVRPISSSDGGNGRKCLHCQTDKTPQWRAGPMGPKTLCNACGVRYKSGRLLPEYRPASSPTFSSGLHSNSHRKVVEMRKLKQMAEVEDEGVMVNVPVVSCGYKVG